MSDHDEEVTYTASCRDCPWKTEKPYYGTAESEALSHSEHTGHSVPTPEVADDE